MYIAGKGKPIPTVGVASHLSLAISHFVKNHARLEKICDQLILLKCKVWWNEILKSLFRDNIYILWNFRKNIKNYGRYIYGRYVSASLLEEKELTYKCFIGTES